MTTNNDPALDPICTVDPFLIYYKGECLSQQDRHTITELRTIQNSQRDTTSNDGGLVVLICLPLLLALLWLNRR